MHGGAPLIANAMVRKLAGYIPLSEQETGLVLDASAAPREIDAQRDLIREGDRPGPVFVMLEGWACRYKVLRDGSRQITAFMMPGDFCDPHTASLEQMDHSVGTITRSKVAFVSRERMEALITATLTLTRAFFRAQG